jgi:hypothetical protein
MSVGFWIQAAMRLERRGSGSCRRTGGYFHLISLMDAIVAICADHRPINATQPTMPAGGDRMSTRLHRKGVSNVRCGAIPSQSSRIQGIPKPYSRGSRRFEIIADHSLLAGLTLGYRGVAGPDPWDLAVHVGTRRASHGWTRSPSPWALRYR